MKNKNFVWVRVAIIIIIAAFVLMRDKPEATAAETIKLGYLAALTGEYSPYGIAEVNSAKMFFDELNKAGGLLGRQVEVIAYDTKSRPEDAVNAVRRMIESDKVVCIMGSNTSSINLATGPLVNAAKVPQIGTATTNPAVTVDEDGKVYPYSFRICYTDPYQGTIAADFAYNDLGKKKGAILWNVGSDYAQGLREFYINHYKELGGEIVVDESYRNDDVDFRAQLTLVQQSGVDFLFLPGLGRDMALIIKQAREMGLDKNKLNIVGGDGYGEFIIDIAREAAIGTYWIMHVNYYDPDIQPVFELYKKTYNEEAKEFGNVMLAYDLAMWVSDAIKRAGVAEGPAIAKALEETKDLKLTHFTLTMDPATHNPLNKPGIILTIGDDLKSQFFKRVEPK